MNLYLVIIWFLLIYGDYCDAAHLHYHVTDVEYWNIYHSGFLYCIVGPVVKFYRIWIA
mgnify:CR=1 FL=1